MATELSYAQALNEAKQIIIQQQFRIKADAEKIRVQQQTILDQSNALSLADRKIGEQADELQRLVEDLNSLQGKLNEMTTAKEQAEAIVDRQGERLTTLQSTVSELERRTADHEQRISTLSSERDALSVKLPTTEDAEALAAMAELLARKSSSTRAAGSGAPSSGSSSPLRLTSDVSAEAA